MKFLILMGLCILSSSCNNDIYNRSYVISKSHLETEPEAASANQEIEILSESSED